MPDNLSKSDIAQELSDNGLGNKRQIMNILDGLADIAADEISQGNDFLVPGIVKIGWTYRPAKAKGERWKKGDEVIGFGGVASIKDSDSPAQKASVKLRPSLRGKVAKEKVSAATMSAFLRSKTGKAIAAKKG